MLLQLASDAVSSSAGIASAPKYKPINDYFNEQHVQERSNQVFYWSYAGLVFASFARLCFLFAFAFASGGSLLSSLANSTLPTRRVSYVSAFFLKHISWQGSSQYGEACCGSAFKFSDRVPG